MRTRPGLAVLMVMASGLIAGVLSGCAATPEPPDELNYAPTDCAVFEIAGVSQYYAYLNQFHALQRLAEGRADGLRSMLRLQGVLANVGSGFGVLALAIIALAVRKESKKKKFGTLASALFGLASPGFGVYVALSGSSDELRKLDASAAKLGLLLAATEDLTGKVETGGDRPDGVDLEVATRSRRLADEGAPIRSEIVSAGLSSPVARTERAVKGLARAQCPRGGERVILAVEPETISPDALLQQVARDYAAGFTKSAELVRDRLEEGRERTLSLDVRPNVCYRVIATSPTGTDLDLEVADRAGRLVGQDRATDNFPVASFCATTAERYAVRLAMYQGEGDVRYQVFERVVEEAPGPQEQPRPELPRLPLLTPQPEGQSPPNLEFPRPRAPRPMVPPGTTKIPIPGVGRTARPQTSGTLGP